MTTDESNAEANAETTEQLIERLEASARRFVRDEIAQTERDLRRNNKLKKLIWVALVPIVIIQVALGAQDLLTALTDFGSLSLSTIGGVVFQALSTLFPIILVTSFLSIIHGSNWEFKNRLQNLTDKLDTMESPGQA